MHLDPKTLLFLCVCVCVCVCVSVCVSVCVCVCVCLLLMPFLGTFCPPDSEMAAAAPILNPSLYISSERGRSQEQKATAKISRPELPAKVSSCLIVCDWLC